MAKPSMSPLSSLLSRVKVCLNVNVMPSMSHDLDPKTKLSDDPDPCSVNNNNRRGHQVH